MPDQADLQSVLLAVTRLEGKIDGVATLHTQEIQQHGREINELRKRAQEYAERTDERLALVETAQAVARSIADESKSKRSLQPLWVGIWVGSVCTLGTAVVQILLTR